MNIIYYRRIKLIQVKKKNSKNSIPDKEGQENNKENKKGKEKDKNEITLYKKEKNKKESSSPKLKQRKSIKSVKSRTNCRKSNSLVQRNKKLEERKKTLEEELKKINDFRKILTKNSKIYPRKYEDEILRKILSFNNKNAKINQDFIFSNKNKKKNLKGRKFLSNKNDVKANKVFSKFMDGPNKNSIVNIINSFKIINQKYKRKNSFDKGDLNNYFKKYELINEDNTPTNQRTTTIDKSETMFKYSIIRHYSFNKKRNSPKKKIDFKNKIKKTAFLKNSFRPETIKLSHNISINFKPKFIIKNNDKKEESNKIAFYSILLYNLCNKYISQSSIFCKTKEEIEEDKKRFLYQLYYCLGLTKIFILNFKENKFQRLFSENLLLLKNKSNKKLSNFSENSGIRFKTFYETFSNYSQIKLSEVEKYESYPNIEQVNQYFIFKDKQLGKGGSSTVYLGEDEEKQRQYAIKVTDKNLKANPFKHIYDYVKEEVSILKRIHSKYIVTTYEVIESKNRIYIIMEYMKQGSVFTLIDQLNEEKIKKYVRNLISAVEHCHKIANIIHKDINVNNLLINEHGVAKLCDFGISEVFEEDNDLLPSKGPSTYTPPEKKYNQQYRGKPADIYLIGLTLFHMVYKRPLFADFGNLTKNDYLNINIPEKYDTGEFVNPNLLSLIKSLLSFNPEERPTINKLKRDPWLTNDMKDPFPDIIKEALFYSLELTRMQIQSLQEMNKLKNTDKNKNDNTKENIDDEDEEEDEKNEEEDEEEEEEEESIEENEIKK